MSIEPKPQQPGAVLVLDDDPRFLLSIGELLRRDGFGEVLTASLSQTALALAIRTKPEACLVDLDLGPTQMNGFEFVRLLCTSGYQGIPVIISADRTKRAFFRAAKCGARDYFVKNSSLDIPGELRKLLSGARGASEERSRAQSVSDLAYLRSFGLTNHEVELLAVFAVGFDDYSRIADQLQLAKDVVRRAFVQIYDKLEVGDKTELAALLQVCEIFAMDN
jgi:DNA-binding NarL/FixJ family response regulator